MNTYVVKTNYLVLESVRDIQNSKGHRTKSSVRIFYYHHPHQYLPREDSNSAGDTVPTQPLLQVASPAQSLFFQLKNRAGDSYILEPCPGLTLESRAAQPWHR